MRNPTESLAAAVTITAIYDQPPADQRIKTMFDRVNEQFGGQVVDLRLWREDVLSEPMLHGQAREDAALSDLLAVSFAGDGRVAERLEHLIEVWAEAHRGLGALVVLLGDSQTGRPTLEFLRQLARRNAVDFIHAEGEEEARAVRSLPGSRSFIDDDPGRTSGTCQRYYGLNE